MRLLLIFIKMIFVAVMLLVKIIFAALILLTIERKTEKISLQ